MKFAISIGGWSLACNFRTVALDQQARLNYLESLNQWVRYYNISTVDIDWESPKCNQSTIYESTEINNKMRDSAGPACVPYHDTYPCQYRKGAVMEKEFFSAD